MWRVHAAASTTVNTCLHIFTGVAELRRSIPRFLSTLTRYTHATDKSPGTCPGTRDRNMGFTLCRSCVPTSNEQLLFLLKTTASSEPSKPLALCPSHAWHRTSIRTTHEHTSLRPYTHKPLALHTSLRPLCVYELALTARLLCVLALSKILSSLLSRCVGSSLSDLIGLI